MREITAIETYQMDALIHLGQEVTFETEQGEVRFSLDEGGDMRMEVDTNGGRVVRRIFSLSQGLTLAKMFLGF